MQIQSPALPKAAAPTPAAATPPAARAGATPDRHFAQLLQTAQQDAATPAAAPVRRQG